MRYHCDANDGLTRSLWKCSEFVGIVAPTQRRAPVERAQSRPMTTPAAFDLLTIGHSNLPAEHFLALLQNAGVTAVVDVRSVPFSRRFPWFSGKALAERLRGSAIT